MAVFWIGKVKLTPLFRSESIKRPAQIAGLLLLLLVPLLLLFLPSGGGAKKLFLYSRLPAAEVADSLTSGHSRLGFRMLCSVPFTGVDSLGPGYFELESSASAWSWFSRLAGNRQTVLTLRQPSFRTLSALDAFWTRNLNLHPGDLLQYWSTDSFLQAVGVTFDQLPCLFLPETHQVYWTSSPQDLTRKLLKAYAAFWTDARKQQAAALGLNPIEACVLASIVQEESNLTEDQQTIAGVYLNRLRANIRLQADPTVRFALQDFSVQRILYDHLKMDSPWNTYLYSGLPPGPINIPEKNSLKNTLAARSHPYLYFCASPDFSGAHRFASDYQVHLRNAREYQKALTSRLQSQNR